MPQLSVSTETLEITCCSLTLPFLCGRMEKRTGGTKGKDHGLKQEQFTRNSNKIRKLTVAATILIEEGTTNNSYVSAHPRGKPNCNVPLCNPEGTPSPIPGKRCELV